MTNDYELLKKVLSIPTVTYKEKLMVDFLKKWLTENNFSYYSDNINNIYVTKQTDKVDYFPCVVSHTDTVHDIDSINIMEEMLKNEQGELKKSLKAYNDKGNPTGIGGDDKCGVFACLELLKELPNIKAAFFVSEETGCHGSKKADLEFFSNVGYCIQFDAPGNSMISEYSMGTQLFDREGLFFKGVDEVLTESFNGRNVYQSHPYTDIYALKNKFKFSCLNFAIGYYQYHSKNEYVVVEDVFNGIDAGKKIIEKLGYNLYEFVSQPKYRYNLFD